MPDDADDTFSKLTLKSIYGYFKTVKATVVAVTAACTVLTVGVGYFVTTGANLSDLTKEVTGLRANQVNFITELRTTNQTAKDQAVALGALDAKVGLLADQVHQLTAVLLHVPEPIQPGAYKRTEVTRPFSLPVDASK